MAERNRLHHAFQQALAQPEARNALVAQGYEIKLTPPDATTAFMRSELQRMAQVVKNASVKID
ncbi:Tripartite tricarboxylate transporter family receptor [compost metagenome]